MNKKIYVIACTIFIFACLKTLAREVVYESPFIPNTNLEEIQQGAENPKRTHQQGKKKWTFIVYIAADNDLKGFAARNIKQMSAIGSNNNINIIVHLDIRIARNHKITRRYYIENNRVLHVNPNDASTERMDSGSPETLISCCKWATECYPAEHYALVLWNHGTGIIDPIQGRILNPAQLFAFNDQDNKFYIDRSVEFLEWANSTCSRGICWDETTGNYLTNQKLDHALEYVRTQYMNGEKFSLITFDACLMSMLEVANIVKKHAHIMVGSQEVELGTGYNYTLVLEPFLHESLTPEEFAVHIVRAYERAYKNITGDYTQSAINLDAIDPLEQNVSLVSSILIDSLRKQKRNSITQTLRKCRNKTNCTHFDEPRYVDLHHFYNNLLESIDQLLFNNEQEGQYIKNKLKEEVKNGLALIESATIANASGRNLSKARGISIYFPEDIMHPSYAKTSFAKSNMWPEFIRKYIRP